MTSDSYRRLDRLMGPIPIDFQMFKGEIVDRLYRTSLLKVKRQTCSILQRRVIQERAHSIEVIVVYMGISGDPYQRTGFGVCQVGNHVQEKCISGVIERRAQK